MTFVGDGRLVYAPVEDLAFGFALVLTSCVVWVWLGRRSGEEPARAGLSVATRLQAMQPTDIGVPGPTSLDMARAFRSVRADPLSFLVEVSERYGDLVAFPVPGAAGAAGQRPRRRPARAADLGAALGQADRAVRRAGPGHRPRPARVVRAELDRAPPPRRPGLPPPAARGRRRPGARGRRRRRSPPGSRGLGSPTATWSTSPRSPTASGWTPSVGRSSPPTCPGRRSSCSTRRATRPSWSCGWAGRSCRRPAWTPTPTNLRLRVDPAPPGRDLGRAHRRSDGRAGGRTRRLARRRPPRPAPRQRPDRRARSATSWSPW